MNDPSFDALHASIYLVGAGPGDPGLITVAGAEVLQKADVVVYDYLANPELLRLCQQNVKLIYVGKSGSQHSKTQDEINTLLVELAARTMGQAPRIIVRLKGGDPYVFGRGGEEGEFLREAGMRFVVIPGITAGIAAAAYAGIPVTHRDYASTITLVTGHEKENSEFRIQNSELGEEPRVNYEALAKLGGTLIFYMGVKSLPVIVGRLMTAGMDAGIPAAVVRWGTRTEQRTVTGTVGTIARVVEEAGIKAPAITIIGKVVGLREKLDWFEERPLFGQRIIVTRTRQQASELSVRLQELGAAVIEAPTIEIAAPEEAEWETIDRTLAHIPMYDWVVFTSPNGVRAAWERLRHLTFDARHFGASHIAAIGAATAKALEAIGIMADVMPEKFVGEELAVAIKEAIGEEEEIRGKRFLLLRADIARPILRETLEKVGGIVEDVAIYRTVKPVELPEEVTGALAEFAESKNFLSGWVTFTSASTATNLWEMLTAPQREIVGRMNRASIGPVTTAALNALGNGEWKPTAEAARHDIAGLVDVILTDASRSA